MNQENKVLYFTSAQLADSPSRRHGINSDVELFFRQKAASFIQSMGKNLGCSLTCICNAITYMHRFYVHHSFQLFHRHEVAATSILLASKVENHHITIEHVFNVAHECLNEELPTTYSFELDEYIRNFIFNEKLMLITFKFDLTVFHPHTYILKTRDFVKASEELVKISSFIATESLLLTTMCLQYKPTVVASFCIYLACQWTKTAIPKSHSGLYWYEFIEMDISTDFLKQLTQDFLVIYEKHYQCASIESLLKKNSLTLEENKMTENINDLQDNRTERISRDINKEFEQGTNSEITMNNENQNEPFQLKKKRKIEGVYEQPVPLFESTNQQNTLHTQIRTDKKQV